LTTKPEGESIDAMVRPLFVPVIAALAAFLGAAPLSGLLVPEAAAQAPGGPSAKQARVRFVAYPGGHIYVDDKLAGTDETNTMTLTPGKHTVRVENRFLGSQTLIVDLPPARVGVVILEW
jgi:hypothetical protein